MPVNDTADGPERARGASRLLSAGDLVGVREIAVEDVGDRYVGWLNDPRVARYLESRFQTHDVASVTAFVEEQLARDDVLMLAIVELAGEAHVGNVKIGPLAAHHGTADLGLLIGEPSAWGRGYGTEAIRLATGLGFDRLRARKLTASCYGENRGSAAAFLRAGWHAEGVRPAQFVGVDGRPQDQLMYGIEAS